MGGEDDVSRKTTNQWTSSSRGYQEKEDAKLWGILLFGLIGATATTFAVSSLLSLFFFFFLILDTCKFGSLIVGIN